MLHSGVAVGVTLAASINLIASHAIGIEDEDSPIPRINRGTDWRPADGTAVACRTDRVMPRFHSGDISEEEWALLQIHMAYCEDCEKLFLGLQALSSGIQVSATTH